jgi:hypothetical protein
MEIRKYLKEILLFLVVIIVILGIVSQGSFGFKSPTNQQKTISIGAIPEGYKPVVKEEYDLRAEGIKNNTVYMAINNTGLRYIFTVNGKILLDGTHYPLSDNQKIMIDVYDLKNSLLITSFDIREEINPGDMISRSGDGQLDLFNNSEGKVLDLVIHKKEFDKIIEINIMEYPKLPEPIEKPEFTTQI